MTIEVYETATVEDALVVGRVGNLTADPERRVDELVDALPAVELQLHDHVGTRRRVGDFSFGDLLEHPLGTSTADISSLMKRCAVVSPVSWGLTEKPS